MAAKFAQPAHQLPARHVTNWVCGQECQSWKLPTGSSENTACDMARRPCTPVTIHVGLELPRMDKYASV